MPKWSDYIRNLGVAGPATVQGIYNLGFALRSEIPALLAKVLRVDQTQSFTNPEKLQGRQNLGLGTISTQDANAVAIAGGSITGITDLAIADGGTGASTAPAARTALGLGNVDNTSDTNKPVSTATQTALNLKANSANPVLTGVVEAEFLRGYSRGLGLANNTTDANNDIDVAAGSAGSDGTVPALMTLATSLTKRLDAAWAAGNNQGGLDTGSKANSTWYYLWLIRNPTSGVVDVLFSASPTAPTLPSGFTQKKRLRGAIRTDAGGNIRPFLMVGPRIIWSTTGTLDYDAAGSVSGALYTLFVPPAYPVIADVNILTAGTAGTIGHRAYTPPMAAAIGPIAAPLVSFISDDNNGSTGGRDQLATNSVGQIGVIISAASTLRIYTNGWKEID